MKKIKLGVLLLLLLTFMCGCSKDLVMEGKLELTSSNSEMGLSYYICAVEDRDAVLYIIPTNGGHKFTLTMNIGNYTIVNSKGTGQTASQIRPDKTTRVVFDSYNSTYVYY